MKIAGKQLLITTLMNSVGVVKNMFNKIKKVILRGYQNTYVQIVSALLILLCPISLTPLMLKIIVSFYLLKNSIEITKKGNK